MAMIQPQVGNWYRRIDRRLLEVVAINQDDATVDIQYFDGTIAELDLDAWHALELEAAPPPEDWSGPLDLDQPDIAELRDAQVRGWQDPMTFVDQLD